MDEGQPLDCLVIGAGPAGLTAAIYLARYHLNIRVMDGGHSRAAMIPRTHNHAGYPGGISGFELLARMAKQAVEFGVEITGGVVTKLRKDGETFLASTSDMILRARTVLLATGVVNNRPPVSEEVHDAALARGLLRYCPVCDAYEVTDRKVAVIGTQEHGLKEAVFLRSYTADVTLIAPGADHDLAPADQAAAAQAGVRLEGGPCAPLRISDDAIIICTPQGDLAFDSIYPALGSVIRSELALMLGADASPEGCLIVDTHQRTSVKGLYAAGDVVRGLDQISHAMGEGGVAATTIRNDLHSEHSRLRGAVDGNAMTK